MQRRKDVMSESGACVMIFCLKPSKSPSSVPLWNVPFSSPINSIDIPRIAFPLFQGNITSPFFFPFPPRFLPFGFIFLSLSIFVRFSFGCLSRTFLQAFHTAYCPLLPHTVSIGSPSSPIFSLFLTSTPTVLLGRARLPFPGPCLFIFFSYFPFFPLFPTPRRLKVFLFVCSVSSFFPFFLPLPGVFFPFFSPFAYVYVCWGESPSNTISRMSGAGSGSCSPEQSAHPRLVLTPQLSYYKQLLAALPLSLQDDPFFFYKAEVGGGYTLYNIHLLEPVRFATSNENPRMI